MGIKNAFLRKNKEPSEDELRAHMEKKGIAVKSTNGREEKFLAFRDYAQEKLKQRQQFRPANPYLNMQQNQQTSNPYASTGDQMANGNPYNTSEGQRGEVSSSPYGNSPYSAPSSRQTQNGQNSQEDPYGGKNSVYGGSNNSYGRENNPYSSNTGLRDEQPSNLRPDPYSQPSTRERPHYGSTASRSSDIYSFNKAPQTRGSNQGSFLQNSPYANARQQSVSSKGAAGYSKPDIASGEDSSLRDDSTIDLNRISSNVHIKSVYKPDYDPSVDVDLNELDEEDDLNLDLDDLPPEQELNSEDEEVEAIKQDIRFTKKESLNLTRNTLRMAQDADVSATNTLGMLGSQSERLYLAEQNLALADTQTGIAKEKVEELRRINRSIFIPSTSMNPFNKKLKLRAQEQRLQLQKMAEKYTRELNRQGVYESEQRIKMGLTSNATNSEIHLKYKNEANLEAAKRYQFEQDSEDDEMEKELALNLDQIALYLKKLKSTANIMSQEVDSQNERLKKIEDDADRLDINVHMNSARLSNIR